MCWPSRRYRWSLDREFRAAPVVTSIMNWVTTRTMGLGNQTRRHANCCMLREGRKKNWLLRASRGTHLRTAPTLFAATTPQIPRLTVESVVVPPLADRKRASLGRRCHGSAEQRAILPDVVLGHATRCEALVKPARRNNDEA